MAATLLIDLPGGLTESLAIEGGETCLVGREPNPSKVGLDVRTGARVVLIPSPSVSANHFVVRHAGDSLVVTDASSRNGTWLKLPAGQPIAVRGETVTVRLTPGSSSGGEAARSEPAAASWRGREDFHDGIVEAVNAWLGQLQIRAHTTTVRSRSGSTRPGGEIPLANGMSLEINPVETDDGRWERILDTLWRWVTQQNALYREEEDSRNEGLILASPAIRRAHRLVTEAAKRGLRLLLLGPSGSGKDGLARTYHRHSARNGAFVAKNCSMFNRELLRAELFGAEQGAFTTAVRRIVGGVESANGGTLFLDEIGEMPLEVQPLLLTFLDRGEYERMGGGPARRVDVQVVSATNKDLRAATAAGEFREDLWFRIAGQVVEVPPLRDRPEDMETYLRVRRLGNGLDVYSALTDEGRNYLFQHPWPGNFRALANFIARLPASAEPASIGAEVCQALLSEVTPGRRAREPRHEPPARFELGPLAAAAAAAYQEDHGAQPQIWDEVKEYIERYFKPLAYAHLGAVNHTPREALEVSAVADALDSDRGTAIKQLNRYYERFFAGARE